MANHFLVLAKPSLVDTKFFLVVAKLVTLPSPDRVNVYHFLFKRIYLPKINLKIYLPNVYYSKPEFPSQCQMDPASICCLQCFFLRLLLFPGMNVLVTPESNPRELVRVKMLKIKYMWVHKSKAESEKHERIRTRI